MCIRDRIFGKKYQAPAEKTKAVARAIASDIMLALINDAGDFNTEIAFVSKTGLRSDIYAVSYDGADVRKVTHHQSILMAPRWSPDGNGMAFTSVSYTHLTLPTIHSVSISVFAVSLKKKT